MHFTASKAASSNLFIPSPRLRKRSVQSLFDITPKAGHAKYTTPTFPIPDSLAKPENVIITENAEYDTLMDTQRSQKQLNEPLVHLKELMESDDGTNINSLENGRVTKLEYQKLLSMDIATSLIALTGVFLSVIAYDIEFEERDHDMLRWILYFIFGTTFIAIFVNILWFLQRIIFLKSRNVLSQKSNIFSTGDIWQLLFETALLLLQPYPFLRGIKIEDYNIYEHTSFYYYVNDFLYILIVVRIYFVARFVLNSLIYRSPRSQRITDMYGADSSYMYACRCLMKVIPFRAVTFLLFVSIFVLGYMLRICERPLNRNHAVIMEFDTYWNSMWCIVLTITTVGFGDVYPRTYLGRVVAFITAFWGIFVVSIMVVTLTNVLAMNNIEEKSLATLRRLELRKKLKNEAAFILTNIARIGLAKKKEPNPQKRMILQKAIVTDLKQRLTSFRMISREIKGLEDSIGAIEEVNRQVGFLRDDIRAIAEAQVKLQNTITQFMTAPPLFTPKPTTEFRMTFAGSRPTLGDVDEGVVISKMR